jgi:drug/metabolite transporter (DMT)-like permease
MKQGGIGLIILAMGLTPGLDAVAKELGQTHEPIMICFARYFSAGMIALLLARVMGERVSLRLVDMPGHLFRAGLMMGAMTAFITALSMVPMADAVGGFLIAPMVATGLSVLLLGETLTRQKALGALFSLLGAAIIMRPGMGLETGTLLALGGGVLLGCYFTASRAASATGGVLGAMAVQALTGSALVAPVAFADGLPSLGADFLFWALVLGVISAACHVLTLMAFRRTEASVLAPFMYFNLFVAVALGVVVFGEIPDMATLAGLAAILAGGLATALTASQSRLLLDIAARIFVLPVRDPGMAANVRSVAFSATFR